MYIPRSYAETDPSVLFDFIEAHPFGALVTSGAEGLFASHLPVVVDRGRGAHGVLQGHLARANPHHRLTGSSAEGLVIFTGADAYITPSWYAEKVDSGKVVPTWNYVAVHAYGTLRFIEGNDYLRPHLERLTALHEGGREHPWAVGDAPEEYIEQLQRAIVGVEIEITRLEGKWKMSQNRSSDDIDGVVQGLAASNDPRERDVATIVRERKPNRSE
jgi:transcriptional regulator